MQKCKGADKYKAVFPPKCNNGRGCVVCRLKWESRNRAMYRRAVKRF